MKTIFGILYCLVYPFFNLFHPSKAIHRENIPEGAALLCPNHTKASDPLFVVFAMGLHHRPQVMAKEEIMRIPVLGWILGKAGVFAVNRGRSDVGAIKRAMRCLKEGDKLLMFPEGTRSKTGEMGEGKTGVAMLALRTQAPIVPIFIPVKKKWFRRTPVVFGEPFYPRAENGKGNAEDYARIAEELMERIAALEGQAV